MPSKKTKLVAALSLITLLGLTACDVQAKPTDYNDVIVTIDDSSEKSQAVYHNISSIVEDAYRDGSLASDVLDDVLYEYSVSIFGKYNNVVKSSSTDGKATLKEAVNNAKNGTDKTIAKTFINDHKAYWSTDKDGKRISDEEGELKRLIAKWDYIEKLIAEKMYEKISGGSYSDRNIFSEKTFVNSLKNSSMSVSTDGTYSDTLLLPSVEPSEVFTKGVLNREHYQYNWELDAVESAAKQTYIEDELIPEIYNELLTEQYLIDKKYNVIGSSYARKVNIFSITTKTKFPKEDDYLMDALIDQINALPASSSEPRTTTTLDDFKAYSNAWLGLNNGTSSIEILDSINAKDSTIFKKVEYVNENGENCFYYNGTDGGELVRKYLTLNDLDDPENYRTVESDVLSDFTNSGAYTKETGLEIKENELKLKDYTTTGWYISNGGLSDLPDSIRTRLFSFSVGTAFKEDVSVQEASDRVTKNDQGQWVYEVPDNESAYLARINGAYYLKTSSTSQGSDPKNDILFYDTSSSTYYVIQVEEAVRGAKLSKDTSAVGADQYSAEKREEVINEVTKCIADTGSYTSLAKVYWLEQMSIQYHDTVVYDYFYANYPELFED